MSDQRPKRETASLEEATISNMWEIAALVEVLERKGLCTKHDLYDIITELRKKNPRAKIPQTAFPEPYLLTETENKIMVPMSPSAPMCAFVSIMEGFAGKGERIRLDRALCYACSVSKPILFHDIDGVLFGDYDGAVQLRPGVSAWLEWAFQHFNVIWLTSWEQEKVKVLLTDTANAHLLQLFQYADWTNYADKATWLADARPRYRERDVYWIDDAAVPVEGVQIIRVNPRGPDELVEVRDRLLFSLLVKHWQETRFGFDAGRFGRHPSVYRWPSS